MSVPLATLRRHGRLAWLHDALDLPLAFAIERAPSGWTDSSQLDVRRGERRSFQDTEQAADWLRFWLGDVAALTSLRAALQRCDPAAPVFDCSDEAVLQQLGARLARGAVVVIESAAAPAPAVLPAAPAAPAIAEPPAVPLSQVLAPAAVAAPLLPVLEEVQIEGAEVLPEIEQSLAQVDITLGEIQLAPVSLEPAPSKVPAITDAMSKASASITGTLDSL